ncbi:uncharacterized protein [Coffea arabica]|uniref:SWIM-type domain-containing protein n=1 Tax=Coffea arabica TaxID=13443 RepID=A0ABM4VUB7_COFAR
MTSRLASKLFVDEVRKAPSMTVHELMTRVTEKLNVDFSLKQRFRRLYMCLEPIKRGFLAGRRKWIGLDGCFLKGPYGRQLLSGVGMDGDNKMFPLALSVVGGLVQVVRDKLPRDEHSCCIQHLYTNFKQMHRGLALKERLWRCARASYMTQFKTEIEMMKQESKDVYARLDEKDPNTWHVADDSLIFVEENGETMSKHEGLLCPAIFDILEKAKKEQCMCSCYYAGTMKYQICCPFSDQFVVYLGSKTCICRQWQLKGIPCGHAVVAINRRRAKSEKNIYIYIYMAPTYWKSTYMKSYEPVLNPINGPNLRVQVDLLPMRPPKYGKSPERPKKIRKKGPDEDRNKQLYVNPSKPHKVSKICTKMSCSLCKKYGHNRRSYLKKTSKLLQ